MINYRPIRLTLVFACFLFLGGSLLSGETVSTVPMNDLINGGAVGDGAVSTIIRDPNGVTVTVHTNNLEPGPHTLWLLIWNDPSRCTGQGPVNCLPPPEGSNVPDSVHFATGNVVPASGRGDFAVRLNVGDTSNVTGGSQQSGLTNVMGAEIHAAVRSKGGLIPAKLEEQLTLFEGGCEINPCAVVQGGVHAPGMLNATAMRLDAMQMMLNRLGRALLGITP